MSKCRVVLSRLWIWLISCILAYLILNTATTPQDQRFLTREATSRPPLKSRNCSERWAHMTLDGRDMGVYDKAEDNSEVERKRTSLRVQSGWNRPRIGLDVGWYYPHNELARQCAGKCTHHTYLTLWKTKTNVAVACAPSTSQICENIPEVWDTSE